MKPKPDADQAKLAKQLKRTQKELEFQSERMSSHVDRAATRISELSETIESLRYALAFTGARARIDPSESCGERNRKSLVVSFSFDDLSEDAEFDLKELLIEAIDEYSDSPDRRKLIIQRLKESYEEVAARDAEMSL